MDRTDVGQKALFCLPDGDANKVCLEDFTGKWVILYFYPKDDTSGCTIEAIDFTNAMDELSKMNAVVLGVSPDSPKSHCRFRDKHELKVTLLSDESKEVLQQYGVWVLKKMYGREYYGVERSTFLVNPKSEIAHVWRKVKVAGHVEAVKQRLHELQSN